MNNEQVEGAGHLEIVNINSVCRLCANQKDKLISIYGDEGVAHDLANKINLHLPFRVNDNDELPLQCCWGCVSTLLAWHDLVITSVEAEQRFRTGQLIGGKHMVQHITFEAAEDITNDQNDTCLNWEKEERADARPAAVTIKVELSEVKQEFSCDLCQKPFADQPDLEEHLKCHKPVKTIQSKPLVEISCEICNRQFMSLLLLKNHISKFHNRKKDKIESDESFENIANLDTKTCERCPIVFRTRTMLKKHVWDKHRVRYKRIRRKKSEIVAESFCDLCPKGFTRKYDMEKHKRIQHSEPEASTTINTQSRPKPNSNSNEILKKCKVLDAEGKCYYKCELCERTFNQSYNLLRHMTVHTGVRNYFCHICGKSFRMSSGLTRHINEHHHGVKKYSCELCGKNFTAKSTKDEHMNIHTNTRPFVCDVCGKAFRQKASLHIHKTFHSNDYRFSCEVCRKKFRRGQELKVHSWLHTGHKPHTCQECGAAFRLGQDLKRHIKIHDKLGQCRCDVCGSTFSQQRYLKVHMQTHVLKKEVTTVVSVG